ncbi:hypothetical protein Ccel_1590 [Ruminiclostridium cellulolyticum H10]|uniref:Uncharacterized protein n=1 Tax=Ruminiclostridium cellulolyticum (strain ATCC 35319 / DSM 5812 / JCM 6584 / H10) TaxID=394503 RepID=B8I2C7_RUMCH|nr:hypothetical protein Ccel_1568 [Ruminiclostridium cellulolyticum H10]ACL75931.1 hypothetical protein Ccel_1579 [Ruminiclostridium cellulolyticum H10]ACL75942.1 hypothetical protein Ccel_1590 [Ruminiclostridium cellulolyticum H10]
MYDMYADLFLKGFGYGLVTGVVCYMFTWGLTVGIRLLKQI